MGWFRRFIFSKYMLMGDTNSAWIEEHAVMMPIVHGTIGCCRGGWRATNKRTGESRDFSTFREATDGLCLELGFDPRELGWFLFRGAPERKSWGWPTKAG